MHRRLARPSVLLNAKTPRRLALRGVFFDGATRCARTAVMRA